MEASFVAEGFTVLHSSAEQRPTVPKLRGVLEAHLGVERARAVRELALAFLTVWSVPVWVAAVRPGWMAQGPCTFVLAAWFTSFVGLVAAGISEARWRRRFRALTERRPRR